MLTANFDATDTLELPVMNLLDPPVQRKTGQQQNVQNIPSRCNCNDDGGLPLPTMNWNMDEPADANLQPMEGEPLTSVPTKKVCPRCHGAGAVGLATCPICGGGGMVNAGSTELPAPVSDGNFIPSMPQHVVANNYDANDGLDLPTM